MFDYILFIFVIVLVSFGITSFLYLLPKIIEIMAVVYKSSRIRILSLLERDKAVGISVYLPPLEKRRPIGCDISKRKKGGGNDL
jgi:hypothetical protein